jgi:hypothetical protein
MRKRYVDQVRLLVDILPAVAAAAAQRVSCFSAVLRP